MNKASKYNEGENPVKQCQVFSEKLKKLYTRTEDDLKLKNEKYSEEYIFNEFNI